MSTELVSDAADRAERLMPISRAAQLIGRNRGTLADWAKKGMPIARRGETGAAHMVDLKDVILWREEQIRREERARFTEEGGADSGGLPGERMSMADRKHLSTIRMNQQKLAMTAKILVHREPMQAAYVRALGLIRQSVMSVPERIFREMAGFPEDRVGEWRLQALGQCRGALEEGAKALNDAMLALADDPDEAGEVTVDGDDD